MKKVICEIYLNGKTPQQAVKYFTDLVNRQKQEDKRWLRIESYEETYGHPFRDGTKELRLIVDKPD